MKEVSLSILSLCLPDISDLEAQNNELSDEDSQRFEAYRLQPNDKFILDGWIDEQFLMNVTPVTQFTK